MEREKFHGRVWGSKRPCAWPKCTESGEFRAPNPYGKRADANGPGDYQWLCLNHVREFNARYDFFMGMSRDEIEAAQMPAAGWDTATRAFAQAGVDSPPSWADFKDPLEAISARFRGRMNDAAPSRFTAEDKRALKILGLGEDADRRALRSRYSELVRQYHPDRNGGDRRFEKKLQAAVEAYQLLKGSSVFG